MDEGDHDILEVAGSTERKGDTNAQMTYCKSSRKGTFIPSMGEERNWKRTLKTEAPEPSSGRRAGFYLTEKSMASVPSKDQGKNSWDSAHQRAHLELARGQKELGRIDQSPCRRRLEILERWQWLRSE